MRTRARTWTPATLLVLALIVVGGLAAHAETVITVGTWLAPESFWGNYGPMFRSFEEKNPGVKIEVVTIGGHGEMAAKTMFLAATGDEHLPDMIQFPPEQIGPVVDAGVFENLQPWIERSAMELGLDNWIPAALQAVQYHGVTFGVPAFVVNYTYAYNPEILERYGVEPPAPDEWVTWEKVRETARRLTIDENGDGSPEIWGFNHDWLFDRILSLLYQAGGTFYTADGLAQVDTPEMFDAVSWLRGLVVDDRVHESNRLQYEQGKIATLRYGSYQMNATTAAGTPIRMAAGIQHREKADVFFVTPWTMTAASKNKELVWKLMTHLTSAESQEYMASQGRVPMRRDLSLPEKTRPYLEGFLRNLEHSRPYPIHNESDFVAKTFEGALAPVWTGEKDPKAALTELQETLNAGLRSRLGL